MNTIIIVMMGYFSVHVQLSLAVGFHTEGYSAPKVHAKTCTYISVTSNPAVYNLTDNCFQIISLFLPIYSSVYAFLYFFASRKMVLNLFGSV